MFIKNTKCGRYVELSPSPSFSRKLVFNFFKPKILLHSPSLVFRVCHIPRPRGGSCVCSTVIRSFTFRTVHVYRTVVDWYFFFYIILSTVVVSRMRRIACNETQTKNSIKPTRTSRHPRRQPPLSFYY